MTHSYKCPICGKINDLKEEASVYRCSACTRTVRAVGFELPLSAQLKETEVIPEPPKTSKRRNNARKAVQN